MVAYVIRRTQEETMPPTAEAPAREAAVQPADPAGPSQDPVAEGNLAAALLRVVAAGRALRP
jgi:hypothetical protein